MYIGGISDAHLFGVEGRISRRFLQGDVDLESCAKGAVVAHLLHEIARQLACIHQFEESSRRVGVADDYFAVNFLPGLERHSRSPSVID